MYIVEDFKVDDIHIQVTLNRSVLLYLLNMIVVLLFLRYETLSWISSCLRIVFSTFFDLDRYYLKLAYSFMMPLY